MRGFHLNWRWRVFPEISSEARNLYILKFTESPKKESVALLVYALLPILKQFAGIGFPGFASRDSLSLIPLPAACSDHSPVHG